MSVEPGQRLARPLVGRDADLARLRDSLGLSQPGGPGAGRGLLLSGDAGIGKTRLLTEVATEARESGWRVLCGQCVDLGESALPYLPFRDMLAGLARADPAAATRASRHGPSLSRLLPPLLAPDGQPTAPDADVRAAVSRGDVLQGMHTFLTWLSSRDPLLVVIEDVHWADPSTRELLGYLLAQPPAGAVVTASYRADDLHRRHPLRAAVAEWSRLSAVTRVALGPLPDAAVRSIARAVAGPLDDDALRVIVDRAGGNAFFAEELAAAGASGGPPPRDLADALLVRLDRLGDGARSVVRAAAVAGREVDHTTLREVTRFTDEQLERHLREAIDANLLTVTSEARLAFRHALLAEVVYDDLLPGERVRLHAAYAATLRDRPGQAVGAAAALARHAQESGDRATAAVARVRAGDEALEVAGWTEAVDHYEKALALQESLGRVAAESTVGAITGAGEATAVIDVVAVTERASRAAAAGGDTPRAVALVRDRLARLGPQAPPEQRVPLLYALAVNAMYLETDVAGVDLLHVITEALELLRPDDVPLRASLLTLRARVSLERGRDDAAGQAAEQAITLAQERGLIDVETDARMVTAKLTRRAGDPDGAARSLEQAVAAARAGHQPAAQMRALYHLGRLRTDLNELGSARRSFLEAIEIGDRLGRPWAPYAVDSRTMAAVLAYITGDWPEVERLTDVSDGSPPEQAWALVVSAGLAPSTSRGDRSALMLIDQLRRVWHLDGLVTMLTAAAGIDLYGDTGNLDAAVELHDAAVAHLDRVWGQPLFQGRIRLAALLVGQVSAALARAGARDRIALVRRADDVVIAAGPVWEKAAGSRHGAGVESRAWHSRLLAEHARLHWLAGVDPPDGADLVRPWREAVAAFERMGHVFETARSRARLAAALRASGEAAEASSVAAQAAEAARRLGAAPLLAELAAAGRGVPRARDPHGGTLTGRELDVLALVAEGRSNGEIGKRLFISTKTVSVHVSNILAKLGATGRTEAVALAHRRGLLDAAPHPTTPPG